MLIKGIGEQHEYRRNDAPVSHADLQTAYKKLLEGKSSGEIFEWKEGDSRTRMFMLSDSGVLTEMLQFETYDHASDAGSLCSTGNVFPYIGDSRVK